MPNQATEPSAPDPNSAVMPINERPPATMVRGEGSWLYDEDGRRYLDLVQGWAVNCLGHAPEVIVRALARQAQTLIHPSPAFHNAPQQALAKALVSRCDLDRAHFCSTGAEANEAAIKLARKWGQAHRAGAATVITTEGSFHGRTLAMMAASGKPGFARRFPPSVPGFRHVPFDDLPAVAQALGPDVVAVMVEPIQGEAGVVVPGADYLHGLRTLCDQAGCLLIFDEVQTGMGRTGPLFAHQDAGIPPDIMTLGKGLGGGVPLAAMLARESVCCFDAGDQGGTYNGNPLMCAVGIAVLEAIDTTGFMHTARARAKELSRGLDGFVTDGLAVGHRGRGLLRAIELARPLASAVQHAAYQRGLLVNAAQPTTIRVMPALNIERDDLQRALMLLREAVAQVLG